MLFVGSHVQVMCLTFTLMVKFYLTGIDFFQVELFHILLFYSIFKFSDKIVKSSVKKSKTIQLEHCNCRRTLVNIEESEINSVPFSNTTCGWDAFQRGTNQRIAGFSFYGNSSSSVHKARKYFGGIEENLRLVRSEYGADWSLRLYYDLAQSDELMDRLCELACSNSHIDLCNVRQLPGNPVRDASHLHPSIWRFLPSLDPQVSVFLSRDLDSRITAREVAAVTEWLQSDRPLHAMRDHPSHRAAVMAGAWGATRSGQVLADLWLRSWQEILGDPLSRTSRGKKIPDQQLLAKWVWPWGRLLALEHDSYR